MCWPFLLLFFVFLRVLVPFFNSVILVSRWISNLQSFQISFKTLNSIFLKYELLYSTVEAQKPELSLKVLLFVPSGCMLEMQT